MDSVDLQVLKSTAAWLAEGHRVVLATVTQTWGSAPRPPGAMLAIRGDGAVAGSVSGGCVEDDLIDKVRARSIAAGAPEVAVYGVRKDDAQRFGLPCGGKLEIVLESVQDRATIDGVLSCIDRHELVARRLDLATGTVVLAPASRNDTLSFDGRFLVTVHGPRWRLLIIGAGQVSTYLARMAQALDYDVIVSDPRQEYADLWDVPGALLRRGMPDDVAVDIGLDAHTAVVAVTHDPKLDDLALLEALKSPAFYVGALGSRVNTAKRRERLAQFDLSSSEIASLHGPTGLRIGSKTPPEIAVAILAEMTAVRHGVALQTVGIKTLDATATTAVCN